MQVKLPEPLKYDFSLDEALSRRRSIRQFSDKPVNLQQVSNILWAAAGITDRLAGTMLRTAPSAGATYPMEFRVIANNVDELEQGLYHYRVDEHFLVELELGEVAKNMVEFARTQTFITRAPLTIVLSAIPSRTSQRYGQRATRYIFTEAGHIAQNIMLESVSLDLVSVPIGAFNDDKLNQFFGFDGKEEAVVYLVSIGYKSK